MWGAIRVGCSPNGVGCDSDDRASGPKRKRIDFIERVACLVVHGSVLCGVDPELQGRDPLEQKRAVVRAAAYFLRCAVGAEIAEKICDRLHGVAHIISAIDIPSP